MNAQQPDSNRVALLVAGPLSGFSAGGGDTKISLFEGASKAFGEQNVVLSTWSDSDRTTLQYLENRFPKLDLVLSAYPPNKPYVTADKNPSKNMYLRSKSTLVGLQKLKEKNVEWVWKIRTDHSFLNFERMASFHATAPSPACLYVKNFRPEIPYMFSDGIQFGHVETLLNLYDAVLTGPQLYNSVHFDDFFHLMKVSALNHDNSCVFPRESEPGHLSLNCDVVEAIEKLWVSRLRLIPETILFPHHWKGTPRKAHLSDPLEIGASNISQALFRNSIRALPNASKGAALIDRLNNQLIEVMFNGGVSGRTAKSFYAFLRKSDWKLFEIKNGCKTAAKTAAKTFLSPRQIGVLRHMRISVIKLKSRREGLLPTR